MTEQMTADQTADARQGLTAQERREEARRMYRESIAAELPMTAKALGEAFGRSTRWGHDRIAEVRTEETAGGPRMHYEEPRMQSTQPDEPRMQHVADDMPAPVPAVEPAESVADVPAPAGANGMPHGPRPAEPEEGGMPPVRPAAAVVRPVRSWPVLLLALPAFVAIWGGWVGLGEMTGFGEINLLPGIVPTGGWATINSAITLPIGVETYAAFALRAWLSPAPVSARARRFAKWSAIGSLALGFCGQVAYHQMVAAGISVAPWWITTLVSGLPVVVLGMGAALAHLLHSGRERGEQ